jgi:hypothetical protein
LFILKSEHAGILPFSNTYYHVLFQNIGRFMRQEQKTTTPRLSIYERTVIGCVDRFSLHDRRNSQYIQEYAIKLMEFMIRLTIRQ